MVYINRAEFAFILDQFWIFLLACVYLFLYTQFASALASIDEIMAKLLKIWSETLSSPDRLSLQVLLCGNSQSLRRHFFRGRYFVPGVYLLIFNKHSTCLIKQNRQYPMTALVDLKDRPPKTLLASLPGNLGVGTRCRSSCAHMSYRWLWKRKSNPLCTQTFNENCIKPCTGWKRLQDQTRLLYGHEDPKTGRIPRAPGECVARCARPWVAGGIQGCWLGAETILPESTDSTITPT